MFMLKYFLGLSIDLDFFSPLPLLPPKSPDIELECLCYGGDAFGPKFIPPSFIPYIYEDVLVCIGLGT